MVTTIENWYSAFHNIVNVLIVDDSKIFTEMICDLLGPFSVYSVSSAASTNEAIKIIEKKKIRLHACLFDLGLMDRDNDEFFLLKKYGKTIPFIIMSARLDPEKAFETKMQGARAYVRKDVVTSKVKPSSATRRDICVMR